MTDELKCYGQSYLQNLPEYKMDIESLKSAMTALESFDSATPRLTEFWAGKEAMDALRGAAECAQADTPGMSCIYGYRVRLHPYLTTQIVPVDQFGRPMILLETE